MDKITVLDSIMGSGKTTFILDMLRKNHEDDQGRTFREDTYTPRRFMVVVPYLEEAKRYRVECPGLSFREPAKEQGRKLNGLLSLVQAGENIITTHSLFLGMTTAVAEAIAQAGYELIVDETPQVLEIADSLNKHDLQLLLKANMVSVDQAEGKLIWNRDDGGYEGEFSEVKQDCLDGYLIAKGPKPTIFNLHPSAFFRAFKSVMVCTYLFKGSVFDAYCQSEGLAVEHMALGVDGQLTPYLGSKHEAERKAKIRPLLSIYEGPRNDIGKSGGMAEPLSASWYKKASPEQLSRLEMCTVTFVDRVAGTSSRDTGWTTYKSSQSKLSGKGYAKGFIAANARATNEHAHKAAMAFLCNWHEHPAIVRFYKAKGVAIDQDQIALSVLLQWIWRSRIRNGEHIHLFIPSERMRSLLRQWLGQSTA